MQAQENFVKNTACQKNWREYTGENLRKTFAYQSTEFTKNGKFVAQN